MNAGDNFSVQFKDADGDMVTISSDSELRQSIHDVKTGGCVRFCISRKENSSVPIQSNESRTESKRLNERQEAIHKTVPAVGVTSTPAPAGGASGGTPSSAQDSASQPEGGNSPTAQVPSGEKLQALLQAAVEALGLPPAHLYECLNGLTPEALKDALVNHSPFLSLVRMIFSDCGSAAAAHMGERTASSPHTATHMPTMPCFWGHPGGSPSGPSPCGFPSMGLGWGQGLGYGRMFGGGGFYGRACSSAGGFPTPPAAQSQG